MEQLIQQLKVILGTNFALYFKAHGFHWNVEGVNFQQYHDFFAELYTSIFNNTDLIAEKIRMLDAYAPGSLLRMLELADVEESAIIPSPISMMAELKRDNDRLIVHLRAGIVAAENAGEPAIGNFLQDLLDQHQKHAWMLRSFIK
jgi:starvation-inducible DNA-binding protein